MLLGFIAGILNKYIGQYFENIDASQLTGSIFGGGVTLNNLSLRSSIFESLGIPFHVVGGKCGQLEVKYSLTRLYSEPIVVTLKELHVLIIPAKDVEYNEEAEKNVLHNEKMRQLEIFETVRHHLVEAHQRRAKRTRATKLKPAKKGESSMIADMAAKIQSNTPQEATYFDIWVMQVLRNIQFNIEGLHVRYEDDITKPLEPFATGLIFQSMHVATTDANWTSQYVKDYIPETSYKLVKLTGLTVYWNSAPTELYKGIAEKPKLFQRLAMSPTTHAQAFHMLFEPILTDLKVQVTPFPDIIQDPFSKPRILIETSLNKFSVNGSDKQFKDIIPFLETLDMLLKSHKYRKYRAALHKVPVHGHCKEWWKFAYDCMVADVRRRRNNFQWEHMKAYRQKCKDYLKAYYKKKAENKSSAPLEKQLTQLEKDLDLFMIILLREHVNILIKRQQTGQGQSAQQQQEQTSEPVEGYIPWLLSWFSYSYWFPGTGPGTEAEPPAPNNPGPSTAANPNPTPGACVNPNPNPTPGACVNPNPKASPKGPNFSISELTSADKEILRIAIGFAKNIDIVSYPDDYVGVEANVLMNQFWTKIYRMKGKHQETVLEGMLEKVSFAIRLRPVDDGLEVELKMGRIEVYGGEYPKEGITSSTDITGAPPLITTANPNVVEYFLKFLYEKNPIDSEVDQKVSFEGLAMQFTYLADSIDRIVECFIVPAKNDLIKGANGRIPASKVLRKVMQFRNSPTARLLRMMENKGKVELNICLIAPYLVIPQDSSTNGKANFVVVNMGEINLVGTLVGGTLCENGKCSYFL